MNSLPSKFTNEWTDGIWLALTRDIPEQLDRHAQQAAKRDADLAQVHRDGWKSIATALERGLKEIASALRDRR